MGVADIPVSTFILMTPLSTAVLISSFVEPEPPWKTRNLALGCVNEVVLNHLRGYAQGLFLSSLLADICLVLAKQVRTQLDVTRLVNTVDVSKACGNGEVWGDLQCHVGVPSVEFFPLDSDVDLRSSIPRRLPRCPRVECIMKRCRHRCCQHHPLLHQ